MADDGADMMCYERPFQIRTRKTQSPPVDSDIPQTISDNDEAECRWRPASVCAGWQRYNNATHDWPTIWHELMNFD